MAAFSTRAKAAVVMSVAVAALTAVISAVAVAMAFSRLYHPSIITIN